MATTRQKSQPQSRSRAKPGERGGGKFFRIEVRPKAKFVTFRYHDVGTKGHIERLAGKRASGSWDDAAWLISKDDAHVENGRLVADTAAAQKILKVVGPARHLKGDIFKGHPRKNVPESEKPTPAMRRAQRANIKKARQARSK